MRRAEFKDLLKRGAGRGTCPHQFAFLLEFRVRRFILSPERLADRLELEEASRGLAHSEAVRFRSGIRGSQICGVRQPALAFCSSGKKSLKSETPHLLEHLTSSENGIIGVPRGG